MEDVCGGRLKEKKLKQRPRSSLLLSNLQTTSFSYPFQATTVNILTITNNALTVAPAQSDTILIYCHSKLCSNSDSETLFSSFSPPILPFYVHHDILDFVLQVIACRVVTLSGSPEEY
jgi:hypothetical protein